MTLYMASLLSAFLLGLMACWLGAPVVALSSSDPKSVQELQDKLDLMRMDSNFLDMPAETAGLLSLPPAFLEMLSSSSLLEDVAPLYRSIPHNRSAAPGADVGATRRRQLLQMMDVRPGGGPPIITNTDRARVDAAILSLTSTILNLASNILGVASSGVGLFGAALSSFRAEYSTEEGHERFDESLYKFAQTLYKDINKDLESTPRLDLAIKYIKMWNDLQEQLGAGNLQAGVKDQVGQIDAVKAMTGVALNHYLTPDE